MKNMPVRLLLFLFLFHFVILNAAADGTTDSISQSSSVSEDVPLSDASLSPSGISNSPSSEIADQNYSNRRADVVLPPDDALFPHTNKEKVDDETAYALPAEAAGLKVGDRLSYSGSVNTAVGKKMYLSQINPRGFVIMVFYQGYWNENDHSWLKSFEARRPEIEGLNVRIVAVSADLPKYASKMIDDNQLKFDVLSDSGAKLLQAFRVLDRHVKSLVNMKDEYEGQSFGLQEHTDLQEYTGRKDNVFAVPSVFILKKNVVIFASVNGDLELEDIMNAIKTYQPIPPDGKAQENEPEKALKQIY